MGFLKKARRRIALIRAVRSLDLSMPIAVGLLVAWISIAPFLKTPESLLLLPISFPAIWFLVTLFRRRELDLIAVEVDRAFGLEERISTAYELISGRIRSSFGDLVLADALDHLEDVDLKTAFPFRPPRRAIISLLLIPLAFLAVHLIPYRGTTEVNPKEREAIAEVAKSLSLLPAEELSTEGLAESFRRTVKIMRDGHLDKTKALKRLAELESEVERQYRKASQVDETMREISQILKASLPFTPESIDASSRIIEKVASDLEEGRIPPEMLPRLEKALRTLFERLKMLDGDLARSLNEASQTPLSPESLRDLARALTEFESRVDDLQILRMMLARIRKGELQIGMLGLEEEKLEGRLASKEGLPGGEGGGEEAVGGRSSGEGEFIPSGKAEEMSGERFMPEGKGVASTLSGRGKFELPTPEGWGGRRSNLPVEGGYRVESVLPDSKTIAEAYKAAESFISSGRVPPLYRAVVRRYFDSLAEGSR